MTAIESSTTTELPFGINLGSTRLFRDGDFHEAFRALRREAPIHWNPGTEKFLGFWSLTKHEDIVFVSRQPLKFISSKGIANTGLRNPAMFGEAERRLVEGQGGSSIITMDPPRHVKMRRLVNKGFTPRAVNQMEPLIREVTNEILDNLRGKNEADFVLEVSSQLPLAVICGMLGLPRDSWSLMFDLTNASLGAADAEYQTNLPPEERGTFMAARKTAAEAGAKMAVFFREQIERRRKEPTDDIVSILLEAEVDGEPLTEGEILAFCNLLVVAGNETTRNAISGGLLALSENPDQKEKLVNDYSHMDTAVEEIIRWVSPLHHMTREATEDVEIRGHLVRKGEKVIMWYPSANRDEDVFEDPYKFDITRDPNDHIAFGIGEHFCLGAEFARKEIKLMFEELFRRFPNIEVAGEPERLRSNFINGIKHLPVTY